MSTCWKVIYVYTNHCPSAHFSENWGYMCMSTIFSGNFFSLIFGINLDRHSRLPSIPSPSSFARPLLDRSLSPSSPFASLGLARYLSPLSQILPRAGLSSPASDESDRPLCVSGSQCYISTVYITTFATFLAILLSVYAGYRDRLREINKQTSGRRVTSSLTMPRKTSRRSEESEEDSSSSSWEHREGRYE